MAMSFTASFAITTPAIGSFTTTDNSNYGGAEPKNTFTNRQLFISYADSTPLSYPGSPAFGYSAYPTDALTVTGLQRDFSLLISMVLTSSNPQPGSIYTATQVVTFYDFASQFALLIAAQFSANPALLDIPQYVQNLARLFGCINMAKTAGFYQQQSNAQAQLDLINTMIQNQTILFS